MEESSYIMVECRFLIVGAKILFVNVFNQILGDPSKRMQVEDAQLITATISQHNKTQGIKRRSL